MEKEDIICPVLIVDDDNDLCLILEGILGKSCPVHIEHSLESADLYLAKDKPLIILLDNNLPDGLGVKHIQQILRFYPDIKIVLMTADQTTGLQELALHEGAVRFLAKPFRLSMINEIIYSICPELRAA